MKLTGKTLEGSYLGAPKASGNLIDVPTANKTVVEIGGRRYERTIHKRTRWRNRGEEIVVTFFVRVNGTSYEMA